MAEHLIQDTTMTGIADKIRSLLGLTGKMSPAQMQTHLTTEKANITAALAALTEKGVTVPAGANSDALAGLIRAIESGGGKILGHSFAAGSFTLTEDVSSDYTVLTGAELFEAIKDDFPGATSLISRVYTTGGDYGYISSFVMTFVWINNVDKNDSNVNAKEFLGGFQHKHKINNISSVVAYTDTYNGYQGGTGGVNTDTTGMKVKFGTNKMGYAGREYRWLVLPVDHGEVFG